MDISSASLHELKKHFSKTEILAAIATMDELSAKALLHDWRFWARPSQIMPEDEPYFGYLLMSGRGFGKTWTGSNWVIERARAGKGPIALMGQTAAEVRDVMIEGGSSSILKVSPPDFTPVYEPSKRRLTWPNGVIAITYTGDEPDQLRGQSYGSGWADELAKWQYAQEAWDNFIMSLRFGKDPRFLVSTTPRPIDIIKNLYNDPRVFNVEGSTYENADNLAPQFLEEVKRKYEGTSLGDQEIHGKIVWDDPGALWKRNDIDPYRTPPPQPPYYNLIIGLDPNTVGNATSNTKKKLRNDECGIILACSEMIQGDLHGYILKDASVAGGPYVWCKEVKKLLDKYPMAKIIAESNQGGEMVTQALMKYGIPRHKVELKHHIRSKYDRAQPIAMLAQQGLIHHCGRFEKLEDEMCSYTGSSNDKSPNRLDAAVIALHGLLVLKKNRVELGKLGL
jgi:phage terminase large subunit-like protein